MLLWFTDNINRTANRFLTLALVAMILWMIRLLAIDIKLETYLPQWDVVPMHFLLALGPLMYFYVLKITYRTYKLTRKDLLHFSPLAIELGVSMLEIVESTKTGAPTYATHVFKLAEPALQVLIFISAMTYLHLCRKRIQYFYIRQPIIMMDRSRLEFRWLRRLLNATALLWLFWIACAAIDLFGYRNGQDTSVYLPFYIFFMVIIIWTAMAAFLKPRAAVLPARTAPIKQLVPVELRTKGAWLKKVMETNQYYQDPELTLSSLGQKLGMHPHELSRVLNTALKKNFTDFINEYRVKDVKAKMHDPAFDHMTLLGIGLEAGFNSRSTYNRIFRQMTGKSPAEYKTDLKKELPSYKLGDQSQVDRVILPGKAAITRPYGKLKRNFMMRNYLKIAWRNFRTNKVSGFINVGGLAVGMAITLLISLWVWDEVSYNTYHTNYNRLGQIMTTQTSGSQTVTFGSTVVPLASVLRLKYGTNFKATALTSSGSHVLSAGKTIISRQGLWTEPSLPEMFSLKMQKGNYRSFNDPSSILLSASGAIALFGKDDPIGKLVRIDNHPYWKVVGVYDDLPANTSLNGTDVLLPWASTENFWSSQAEAWDNHGVQLYVQLNPNADFDHVSAQIKNITTPYNKSLSETVQVFPMPRWHLYGKFENGRSVGGSIQFVWLFSIIGAFVLLLACINFMNLSTARSEKRAREVGIRKAAGSLRSQLVMQFLVEAMLVVFLALGLAIILTLISLPYFNTISGKHVAIPWGNYVFWLSLAGYAVVTGLISGSYPAFYLSGFKPIKVLKGPFKLGKKAATPRKILVVLQFSVSIILIIGTIVIFRQIQYAANRPVGYIRNGLITVNLNSQEVRRHYEAVKNDLVVGRGALDMALSSNATTELGITNSGFEWEGKAPGFDPVFGQVFVSADFGKTIGWRVVQGRDFSPGNLIDTGAFILNESAVKLSNIKNPIGKTIHWFGKDHIITGVVKDLIMESPYTNTRATIFQMQPDWVNSITIRINTSLPMRESIKRIEQVFKKYDPNTPFLYTINDEDYDKKFATEKRVGRLASLFTTLAIFISCLGLFGMASFMAEQRTKEIGIRKVLGASTFNLWQLLSKDFILLVVIAIVIAIPVAYYYMYHWLQAYEYQTRLSWWIFLLTAFGAIILTLITVSFQSIKAALANPVKSLRTE